MFVLLWVRAAIVETQRPQDVADHADFCPKLDNSRRYGLTTP